MFPLLGEGVGGGVKRRPFRICARRCARAKRKHSHTRYEQHDSPTIAAGWTARVGSVNERPGITGISHFFEHMMFKGTKTIGTKNADEDLRIIDGTVEFDYDSDVQATINGLVIFASGVGPVVIDVVNGTYSAGGTIGRIGSVEVKKVSRDRCFSYLASPVWAEGKLKTVEKFTSDKAEMIVATFYDPDADDSKARVGLLGIGAPNVQRTQQVKIV